MAKLNLTTNQFSDVAMIWLFDQVMNPEQITNERLKEWVDENRGRLKSPLMAYYFDSPPTMRQKYRWIGGAFDGTDKSAQDIRIYPNEKEKEKNKKKDGILKKIVKKVIKKALLKKEGYSNEELQMLKEVHDVYERED
jgi:hypothetical protein